MPTPAHEIPTECPGAVPMREHRLGEVERVPIDYLPSDANQEKVDDWFSRRIEYLERQADRWAKPWHNPAEDLPELRRMSWYYGYREQATALRCEWERRRAIAFYTGRTAL